MLRRCGFWWDWVTPPTSWAGKLAGSRCGTIRQGPKAGSREVMKLTEKTDPECDDLQSSRSRVCAGKGHLLPLAEVLPLGRRGSLDRNGFPQDGFVRERRCSLALRGQSRRVAPPGETGRIGGSVLHFRLASCRSCPTSRERVSQPRPALLARRDDDAAFLK